MVIQSLHWNEIELHTSPREAVSSDLKMEKGEPEMTEFESGFLCGILNKFKPNKILEVGIASGGTTAIILRCMADLGGYFVLHSVDLSKRFYRDNRLKSGYLGVKENKILKKNDKGNYDFKLHLGNVACSLKLKDEIGDNIDCLVLDTIHRSPGEILDFISILPVLRDGCVVILHDIILSQIFDSEPKNRYATSVLFSNVSGQKYLNFDKSRESGLPNIGAFVVDETTRSNIINCFLALLVPWGYFPDGQQLTEYRNCIRQRYDDDYVKLYDASVALHRKKKNWIFPSVESFFSCKVVCYGAGEVGQAFYQECLRHSEIKITGWIDKIKRGEIGSVKICPIESIVGMEYDHVVITIFDSNIVSKVRDMLINLGVDDRKIVWINPQLQQ